jgi:chemotaxis protein CheX
MDASYINPVVQGTQRVCTTLFKETPVLGKVYVKTRPYTTSPVTVSIDIVGNFDGEIVYNMDEATGCYIASQMMYGMPVDTLVDNPIAQSSLAEIGNIISGNIATIFSGKGIIVDIKPPRFQFDASESDFPIVSRISAIICVPLHFQNGHVLQVDVLIPPK